MVTQDLVSYKIEESKPLRLVMCTEATGKREITSLSLDQDTAHQSKVVYLVQLSSIVPSKN